MSLKPQPGSITDVLDHEAVLNYQAAYLASKFAIGLTEARAFVDRYGLDRRALNVAVRQQLLSNREGA